MFVFFKKPAEPWFSRRQALLQPRVPQLQGQSRAVEGPARPLRPPRPPALPRGLSRGPRSPGRALPSVGLSAGVGGGGHSMRVLRPRAPTAWQRWPGPSPSP